MIEQVDIIKEALRKKIYDSQQAYLIIAQQYHLVCNIHNPDRHSVVEWTNCIEPTCVEMKKRYNQIWNE